MANILLTGAGFSRNWGGWLADEAFEYLLGVDGLHPRVRRMLWDHKERKTGFEGVYTVLRDTATNPADCEVFEQFDQAVAGMFHVMRNGFASQTIYSHQLRFLSQFEAIFTLNQDTLLEQKYLGFGGQEFLSFSDGRLFGAEVPGLRNAQDTEWMPPGFYTPANPPFNVRDRYQPYFKLHGSSNWAAEGGKAMLILGGGKETEIQKHPLLAWYFSEFERCLTANQIVIIGYSFNDEHINKRLKAACGRSARFFIVDPTGVEVIDKRNPMAQIAQPRGEFMEAMLPCIDGASRRNLLATLENDNVERTKLNHFMTAHERRRV